VSSYSIIGSGAIGSALAGHFASKGIEVLGLRHITRINPGFGEFLLMSLCIASVQIDRPHHIKHPLGGERLSSTCVGTEGKTSGTACIKIVVPQRTNI